MVVVSSKNPSGVGGGGAGSFGRNHARVYDELQKEPQAQVALVAVVDRERSRAQAVADEVAGSSASAPVRVFSSVDKLISSDVGAQAASVAVPTVEHLAVATTLMEAGVECLIG